MQKKLVAPLIGECTATVEEVKSAKITHAENENICSKYIYILYEDIYSCYKCSSCTVYIVLFWIYFTINVGGRGASFVYFHGYLKKMFTRETIIH